MAALGLTLVNDFDICSSDVVVLRKVSWLAGGTKGIQFSSIGGSCYCGIACIRIGFFVKNSKGTIGGEVPFVCVGRVWIGNKSLIRICLVTEVGLGVR